jgi:hypothetical protein
MRAVFSQCLQDRKLQRRQVKFSAILEKDGDPYLVTATQ